MASMIKPTKLTDEEFNKVNELQKEFQIIALQMGELHIIERNLEEELDKVKTELKNFYLSYKKVQEKEKELVNTLELNYPGVNINFETGELS
jgi:short-subunit dehydrogenase involved in D-alanine esterification of teichoic acids